MQNVRVADSTKYAGSDRVGPACTHTYTYTYTYTWTDT
jgi:hypothetical protein